MSKICSMRLPSFDVAKECHLLFVEEVKNVEESVKLKMDELKPKISKEVVKIEQNYTSLHNKVDVLADVIKKLVEYNTFFSTKHESKKETDSKVFEKMEEFWEV
ncbi:unnamed protein product [Lactuca saligna]|uniref:Uncharacterized protein n=1 Tax=Lactuca saligna TaxID=75948 RepID=A0AA35ZBR3_LACSI|nr:unnamed protein product [Lactuca saligna]